MLLPPLILLSLVRDVLSEKFWWGETGVPSDDIDYFNSGDDPHLGPGRTCG